MTIQRYRLHRNVCLAIAICLQASAMVSPVFVLLSLPLGLVLSLVAAERQTWVNELGGSGAIGGGGAARVVGVLVGGAALSTAAGFGASVVGLALGQGFQRGRQIRVNGRVALPALEVRSPWSDGDAARIVTLQESLEPELRAALAARWRENGKTEHASVAAFAKLSLDLIELGAPPVLLEAASRDGADEIRHARLCFALARSLDGRDEGPTVFPAVKRALAPVQGDAWQRLAVDSLFDGVVHEGLSARVLARLARRCEIPAIASMLREIAADEGRHAAHAWDVVELCAARGGAPVLEALEGALTAIPTHHETDLPLAARDGSWERWGIHGAALEAECWARTLEHVRARVEALGIGLAA